MAVFRYFPRKIILNTGCDKHLINYARAACVRMLNYSAIVYDGEKDPAPLFFDKEVQGLLKFLTRIDIAKVYRKKRTGEKKLNDPEYKFMTDEELDRAMKKAIQKMDYMLQMPPVVGVRKPISKILTKDPALQGLETSRMVFTDITFGVKDCERLIVVREPDGTLQEAEWDLRHRINQVYFPKKGRSVTPPRLFEDRYLEDLLKRQEYEFILDNACFHFEPNDLEYQKIVSIVYQHVNDNNGFESLRSTRHFGVLTFFLVWNKSIDNLLLDMIETAHIEEASRLVEFYCKAHDIPLQGDSDLAKVEEYVKTHSYKRSALELGIQAYKDFSREKEELERGIKQAHGFS